MRIQDFQTKEINTWCPGCYNFMLLNAIQNALVDLVNESKIEKKNIAMASGIGCHAKIFDYININGFYSLHGRVIPPCIGMKAGNPELTVIGFGGDGDTYAEGMAHFIHACRYNTDFTMVVHNNKTFALTTGQATPTSEKGFVGGSTPFGKLEEPINPIALAVVSGATFVARGYTNEKDHLKELFKKAVMHKGFALVDVLQPCLIYNNPKEYLEERIYKLDDDDSSNYEEALKKVHQWNYSLDESAKIPIGVFYKVDKPSFEEKRETLKQPWYKIKREVDWEKMIKQFQ
ncbi:MAG: thiamine pyrophosphate-dependent enzyme [Candidatus Nealsonbacteria bacterium]